MYDQGEDRWLSTLLLKTGWTLQYCASADARTFCPETFSEFYNQRRRWVTSTIANLQVRLSLFTLGTLIYAEKRYVLCACMRVNGGRGAAIVLKCASHS